MAPERTTKLVRCAIYTRKSSEEGLEQSFNSLDAQREACLAYIQSQRHEGWRALPMHYDDGGYSGGTMERPALTHLLADVQAGRLETVVVYKVDRLTRSLMDFAKIIERFESSGVSFVSVTQQFNTTSSIGRLTLNVLLSFAQFEREVTGERIRDKIAASKRKGLWMGGAVPLGYRRKDRKLVIHPKEATTVRLIYRRYLALQSVRRLKADLDRLGIRSRRTTSRTGEKRGGGAFFRGALYTILKNRIYRGEIAHRGAVYPGQHTAIVPAKLWDAVQRLLVANTHARQTGAQTKEPSLLAGLLYDQKGQRMTPKHTTKRGRRYRYYVSQAIIQQRGKTDSTSQVPAHDVEQPVLNQLTQWLRSKADILDQVARPTDDAAARKALLAGAEAWADLTERPPVQIRAFLLATLRQVRIQEAGLKLLLSREGLRTVLFRVRTLPTTIVKPSQSRAEGEDTIDVPVRTTIRRHGGVTRLIIPGESQGPAARPNHALMKAVARAHVWAERLFSGKVSSMRVIAREEGVHEAYVGRLLPLAFLAPDLVEIILQGKQPPELTLDRLIKNLPLGWVEQRRAMNSI